MRRSTLDATSRGLVHVAEHAAGDATEERGPVGRALLLRRRRLQRHAEHRRDDAQPEVAAGAAARDSRVGGLDSELAQRAPASHADRRPRPPTQHGRALRDRGAALGRRRRRAHQDRRAAFARRPGTGGRRARRRLRSSRGLRRRGRRTTPRAPGGRGTTAASRRRRASRPWRATPPAPRGRRCGEGQPAPAGTPAVPRTRRPRCRARSRAARER